MSKKLIIISISLVIIIIIIIAILYHPNRNDSPKNPIIGNPKCGQTLYSCNTDIDCEKCEETIDKGVELSCIQLDGQSGKICSLKPSAIKSECNANMGGINVWTAWDNPDRMEWDCFCTRPDWASGPSVSGSSGTAGKTVCNLNPDICVNGSFTWDTSFNVDPNPGFCFCNDGYSLYTNNNYPICIPNDPLTEYMYTDYYTKDERICQNNCSGNGYCSAKPNLANSHCICKDGFSGDDCSIPT